MFGKPKPVVYDPYARRRSRGLMPRWLVLILLGAALGVAGVFYVQERLLPPRLSADASTRLQKSFDQADAERTRLAAELAAARQQAKTAVARTSDLQARLAASKGSVEQLRADVNSLIDSLPPDPRGGKVAVRAARFEAGDDRTLAYDVVLSRDRSGGKPLDGVIQFVVSGAAERGVANTVSSQPLPVSVGAYDSVRGSIALPAGFKPLQATIQVLDKPGGNMLGKRVMYVR